MCYFHNQTSQFVHFRQLFVNLNNRNGCKNDICKNWNYSNSFYLSCKQKFSDDCRVYHSIYDAQLVADVLTPTCEHSLPLLCNHLADVLPSWSSPKVSHLTRRSCFPSVSDLPTRDNQYLHRVPPRTCAPQESEGKPSQPGN